MLRIFSGLLTTFLTFSICTPRLLTFSIYTPLSKRVYPSFLVHSVEFLLYISGLLTRLLTFSIYTPLNKLVYPSFCFFCIFSSLLTRLLTFIYTPLSKLVYLPSWFTVLSFFCIFSGLLTRQLTFSIYTPLSNLVYPSILVHSVEFLLYIFRSSDQAVDVQCIHPPQLAGLSFLLGSQC